MPKTITFKDAHETGVVQPGHYFLTEAPEDRCVIVTLGETGFPENPEFKTQKGGQALWRLDKGLTMLGEVTREKLTLKGYKGYEKGPETIHRVARELHSMPIFEQVRACSLPKEEYQLSELKKVKEEANKYQHPDDRELVYWLASCCVESGATYEDIMYFYYLTGCSLGDPYYVFYVFLVNSGSVNHTNLYYTTHGNSWSHSAAVRPEATPKATLLLETEGCDGTRSRPWKCLSK